MKIEELRRFGRRVRGDIGLEIELEGRGLDVVENDNWHTTRDGSLRNGLEYVLNNPVNYVDLDEVLDELFDMVDVNNIIPTYRAGIHIHINVRELTPKQVINMFTLYTIFEDCILGMCDPTRRNNLFCLSSTCANGYVDLIKEIVGVGDLEAFNTNNIKYSALNLKPVQRYGSVEFRALESTTDTDKIKQMCGLFLTLRKSAQTFSDPIEICNLLSAGNLDDFIREVFSPRYAQVITEQPDYRAKVRRGILNIQDLCYSFTWEQTNNYIWNQKNKNVFFS